jgi:predicted dehydrogenase
MTRVALVGCGRWGSRLLRALQRHPTLAAAAVVDIDPRALARAARIAPDAHLARSLEQVADRIDAAVIATPSGEHAAAARRALELGLDVLVEKPLATSAADAHALADLARKTDRVAMVGHVLRYHPAVERLVALIGAGAVGALREITFVRCTQSGSPDPLWTLAPHDLATLHAIDPAPPRAIEAHHRASAVHLDLELASGLRVSLTASTTADPRRLTLAVGTRGHLAFDELAGTLSLALCSAPPRTLPLTATGPLDLELDHFARCIRDRRPPRTSFDESARIIDTLERAHELLRPAPIDTLAIAR